MRDVTEPYVCQINSIGLIDIEKIHSNEEHVQPRTCMRRVKKPEKMALGASDNAIVRAAIRQGETHSPYVSPIPNDARPRRRRRRARMRTGSEPIASGRVRRRNNAARVK